MPIKAFKQTRTAHCCITDHLVKQIRELCPDKTAAESDEVLRMSLDNAITDATKIEYVFDVRSNRPTLLVDVSAYYRDIWIVGTQNDKPGRSSETAYVTALSARKVQSSMRDGSYIDSTADEYKHKLAKALPAPPRIERVPKPIASVRPTLPLDDGERVVVLQSVGEETTFKVCTLAEAKMVLADDPTARIFRELKTKRVVNVEVST